MRRTVLAHFLFFSHSCRNHRLQFNAICTVPIDTHCSFDVQGHLKFAYMSHWLMAGLPASRIAWCVCVGRQNHVDLCSMPLASKCHHHGNAEMKRFLFCFRCFLNNNNEAKFNRCIDRQVWLARDYLSTIEWILRKEKWKVKAATCRNQCWNWCCAHSSTLQLLSIVSSLWWHKFVVN